MRRFGWAIDGYGNAHMCEAAGRISILSMLPGESGISGRFILEDQDEIQRTEFIIEKDAMINIECAIQRAKEGHD